MSTNFLVIVSVGIVVPSAFQAVLCFWCFLVPRSRFVAAVALIVSSGIWAWGKMRWAETSIGNCQRWSSVCRASAAIRVKNVQVTQLLEWVFSLPSSSLLLYCRGSCKEGRGPASSLRLPLLAFLLGCLLDIWSVIFFFHARLTAGVSYPPKWQRSLFLEPGVQCWIAVLLTQLAVMGN